MADGYTYKPEAFTADIETWTGWAGQLGDIGGDIPLDLSVSIFGGLGGDKVYAAYQKAATTLKRYVDGGEKVFEGFATTLTDIKGMYDEAEQAAGDDVAALQEG